MADPNQKRVKVVGSLFVVAFLGILMRIFQISVLQHEYFLARAEDQQTVEYTVFPRRGDIYAQDFAAGNRVKVVTSAERYSLSAVPANVKKKAVYASILAKYSDFPEDQILRRINTEAVYMQPVAYGLTQKQLESIATDINAAEKKDNPFWKDVKLNLDASQGSNIFFYGGVFFTREYQRSYPQGASMSQVLGFVNNEGIGRYGIESEYDSQLKGQTGKLRLEQDSLGTLLTSNAAIEGSDGNEYVLTIDRNVQYFVEQELEKQVTFTEAKSGSAVVMDSTTGAIIAMANYPTYDPEKVREIKPEEIDRFTNGVVSTPWEPGSIFKPLVMAAALDQKLVDLETEEEFGESVTIDKFKIETALRKSYGRQTMTKVLQNSDNVGMVWVSDKLGNQKMYDYLNRYGIGKSTNIDVDLEYNAPLLPVKQWRNVGRATLSFGQGILVTPIQMVKAYSAFTSKDGSTLQPYVVASTIRPDGTEEKHQPVKGPQVLSPETAKNMREMLVTVISTDSKALVKGYKIAGKTGTAQVADLEKGGYLENAYNHSVTGFAPADDPRFIVLVRMEQPNLEKVGTFASGSAVPSFGRIMSFLLQYFQIPPSQP